MKISVYKIFWTAIFIITGILAVHSFFVLSHHFISTEFPEFLVERFNIDAEANIPTWFSTILLFLVSVTAFFIHRLKSGRPDGCSCWNKIWLGLGILYLFLSIDEAAQIHELINRLTDIKWVFIYTPLFGTIFLVFGYYFFVVKEEVLEIRNWIIGGLIVFAIGGLLFEWINYTYHLRYAWRQISYVLEEGFEMIGTTMVLIGCLRVLNIQFKENYLKVGKR